MFKLKINYWFRKSFAIFVALSVALSMILAGGFGASAEGEGVLEAEIQYGLWYLDSLPLPSEDFGLKKPSEEEIESITKSCYFDKDGEYHEDPIDSKKVYNDIKIKVDELTAGKETCLEKAKVIYEWIFENVTYDYKGQGENGSRDAIAVFHSKRAICFGYANLASLMMRIANIPCFTATSSTGLHSWNIVYLNDKENNRQGYTIFDSCWASTDLYPENSQDPMKLDDGICGCGDFGKISQINFPALNAALSLENANREFMKVCNHQIGDVRLGCLNDINDSGYYLGKNGISIELHWCVFKDDSLYNTKYLTLTGWKKYDNNITISDDLLPVELPVYLPEYAISDAKKIVISGDVKVIFPASSDISDREKLIKMKEKFDFKDSNIYEFQGDKLVDKSDENRVVFDFNEYEDLSLVAKELELANKQSCQIFEKLGKCENKSSEQYIKLKNEDNELEKKRSDLKNKYKELLKKHDLV